MTDFERSNFVKTLMESGKKPGANNNGGVNTPTVARGVIGNNISFADAESVVCDWVSAYAKENPAYKVTVKECARIAAATDWLGCGTSGNHIEVYRSNETGEILVYDLIGSGSTVETDDVYLGSFNSKCARIDVAERLYDEYGCATPKSLRA